MLPRISILSSLLPITFFLLFCFKNGNRGLWVIFLYSISSLLFDLFLFISPWAFENKYLVWNTFAILEYSMISYFFYRIINSRSTRIFILISFFVYLLLFCLLASTSDDHFNSVLSAVGSVIILTLCLIFFVHSMKLTAEPVSLFSPIFLIVIALLVYVSSTLFLYIVASRLSDKEMEQYWIINHIVNILMNLIFSIAFISFHFQRKNPSPENASVDFTRFPDDR